MMATQYDVDADPLVRAIRKLPALRREDNTELARIIAKGGDEGDRARDKMVTGNMRLVLLLARKYPDGSLTLHDRLQEGAYGLMRAVAKYDPERGISFATYATFWVRASIERAISSNEHTITIPSNVVCALRRLRKAQAATPRSLTNEETAEALHMGNLVVSAVQQLPLSMVPLDSIVAHDADTLVIETLIDNISESVLESLISRDVWQILEQIPDVAERDKTMTGLFAFGETYSDIAKSYGLSRERVRQVISAVLIKVRNVLTQ